MAEVKITISDELMNVMQTLAEIHGVSVEQALLDALKHSSIEEMEERLRSPMIGILEGGEPDISQRDEEILNAGWEPD